mmetsp:Transcript_11411/g.10231  ORF Transcript_11411/g.10231 Transcript_11411/m.10231 type:complete len:81 (+) Transcript_11411:76-318(+)
MGSSSSSSSSSSGSYWESATDAHRYHYELDNTIPSIHFSNSGIRNIPKITHDPLPSNEDLARLQKYKDKSAASYKKWQSK